MQKTKILNQIRITSGAMGVEDEIRVPRTVSALSAKTGAVYLQVHEVDDDTQIQVRAKHTADVTSGFADLDSTTFFDSGLTAGIEIGMQAGDGVDVAGVDELLLVPTIQYRSGTTAEQKAAVISLWLILKPF